MYWLMHRRLTTTLRSGGSLLRIFIGEAQKRWLFSPILDQRPTDFSCGFKIVEHRLINFAQILPRIFVAVKAVEKQHIGQQAEHPIDVGRVPDDRLTAGRFEKLFGELLSLAALEHAARGEINEIGFHAEAFEGVAKRLFTDGFKNRFYFSGRAVKGEIKDRRVGGAGIVPE